MVDRREKRKISSIYMTKEEYAVVERAAKIGGESVAAFIRRATLMMSRELLKEYGDETL